MIGKCACVEVAHRALRNRTNLCMVTAEMFLIVRLVTCTLATINVCAPTNLCLYAFRRAINASFSFLCRSRRAASL